MLLTPFPRSRQLVEAAARLAEEVDQLRFGPPVTHVYNPLRYAWDAHQQYLNMVPEQGTRILFLGMNPGPWGMAQTGVPFGEVNAVRGWLGIEAAVDRPQCEHPQRPVQGFQCERSEVSGERLWGLFQARFGKAQSFFREHVVLNYCPLVFMEASGRNRTPDKLPLSERRALDEVCDRHLADVIRAVPCEWLIGVGAYAEQCLRRVAGSIVGHPAKIGKILHPSPASPAANRGWAAIATQQLIDLGVWKANR